MDALRPERYVDTHGRHGWLYRQGGRWVLEHCVEGRWQACPMATPDGGVRTPALNREAYRHLRRRPHAGSLPLRLLGTHHAGGGLRHDGFWVKGAERGGNVSSFGPGRRGPDCRECDGRGEIKEGYTGGAVWECRRCAGSGEDPEPWSIPGEEST